MVAKTFPFVMGVSFRNDDVVNEQSISGLPGPPACCTTFWYFRETQHLLKRSKGSTVDDGSKYTHNWSTAMNNYQTVQKTTFICQAIMIIYYLGAPFVKHGVSE